MKEELKISFRSLLFRWKQYVSLFFVCIFGIGISLFSLFLMKGMLLSLEEKAKIYYGGDYQFVGETADLDIYRPEKIINVLKKVFPEETKICERYDLDAIYSTFYFEGTGVRQKVIKGIHFEDEFDLLSSLNFIEGKIENFLEDNKNYVLLSEPISKMLGVHLGDSITFLIKNRWGQLDTRDIIVKGIFRDSSLFGMYTSYMDINFLKEINKYPDDYINRICINLPNKNSKKDALYFQKELEKELPMFPLCEDKKEFYNVRWTIEMPKYALIKLSANLQDVQILIDAMKLISTLVIVILVIIIIAGVSSTYRVIVMKRINEIGIYKALGITRQKISIMFLMETFFIILSGCVFGFVFSLVLCKLISLFDFSFIPAFDIFLVCGKMIPVVNFTYTILICFIVFVTTLVAVWFSIKKSVEISPCEALSVVE